MLHIVYAVAAFVLFVGGILFSLFIQESAASGRLGGVPIQEQLLPIGIYIRMLTVVYMQSTYFLSPAAGTT